MKFLKTKFKLWLLSVTLPILGGAIGLIIIAGAVSSMFWFLQQNERGCDSGSSETTVPETPGAWTEKGTTRYNNALTLWNDIKASPYYKGKVEGDGMVAGMVGNAATESAGFPVVDIAQGAPGNSSKDSSISEGVVPSGGGGGLFQFTPYTDFAPLGDKKWLDVKAQVNFLFEAKMGANRAHITYQQFVRTGNQQAKHPEITADWFLRTVERPADPDATVKKRQSDAEAAYVLFSGLNNEDIGNNVSGGQTQGDSNGMYDMEEGCRTGGVNAPDGSGQVPDVTTRIWTNDGLPKEMKKYAIDAEQLGLTYTGPSGWLEHSGQCVDLTESLGPKIWGVDMVVIIGDGKDQAQAWATKYGRKTSNKPQAGAIFSTIAGAGDKNAGHTGIVSHVFEDGTMLVIEQNVKGYSGAAAAKKDTWDYRLISKADASDTDYKYYMMPGHAPKLPMKG